MLIFNPEKYCFGGLLIQFTGRTLSQPHQAATKYSCIY